MNIFHLDSNLERCATYHVDKHIVKMPLELAQLLCTARRELGDSTAKYRSTHKNHPCAIFTRQSRENFEYVCTLGKELCKEYSYRYGKTHACEEVIDDSLASLYLNNFQFPTIGLTNFPLAMPDDCKTNDAIESYRMYYCKYKRHLAVWSKRNTPKWYEQ